MQSSNAQAGPSRIPRHPPIPFVCASHKPDRPDGRFRVLIITSGSVASVKLPLIVGELVKSDIIDVQVAATRASLHFYTQDQVDCAVRDALSPAGGDEGRGKLGVKVWTDADEWSDWHAVGDPILHIELRRWADLVVVAPCSADFLAKLAAGFSDNLALSILRALPPSTPVILFPAMNTHMYQHAFTAEHLAKVQKALGYMVNGPQGAGMLACGDEGPGKMTDWREIVAVIQDYAAAHVVPSSPPPPAPLPPDIDAPTLSNTPRPILPFDRVPPTSMPTFNPKPGPANADSPFLAPELWPGPFPSPGTGTAPAGSSAPAAPAAEH